MQLESTPYKQEITMAIRKITRKTGFLFLKWGSSYF